MLLMSASYPLPRRSAGRFSLRVPIRAGEAGLPSDSWAKCDQVTTVEKILLLYPPLGKLGSSTLEKVEQGVKLALQLT